MKKAFPKLPDTYVKEKGYPHLVKELKIRKITERLFDKIIEENGKVKVSYLGENNLKIDPLTPILTLTLDDSIAEKIRSYDNVTLDDLDKAASLIIRSIVLSFNSNTNRRDFYSDLDFALPFSDDLKKYQMHLFFPNHYDGKMVINDLREHGTSIKNEILSGRLALQGNYGRA